MVRKAAISSSLLKGVSVGVAPGVFISGGCGGTWDGLAAMTISLQ